MNREIVIILAVSLLSVVAGITLYRYTLHQPEFVSARPSSQLAAPDQQASQQPQTLEYDQIVLNDLQNQPHYLSEWTKPVQIVNFWAPWCAPCRREIPALVDLQKSYQDKVQFIGLSFDSVENVINFKNKYPLNYPLLLVQREASQINQFFGNSSAGLPFTAILNEQREIVYQHVGEISREQLEEQIKALL